MLLLQTYCLKYYKGWHIRDIKKDIKSGKGDGVHFVYDDKTGKYIDMKHMLVAGQYGNLGGVIKEATQLVTAPGSAFQRQDLFSNNLGQWFYYQYGLSLLIHPRNATIYIQEYLTQPSWLRFAPIGVSGFPYFLLIFTIPFRNA